MSKIRAILLDLDNTLYPYNNSHWAGLQAAKKLFNSEVNRNETFDELYDKARRLAQKDLKSRAASHHRLLYFQSLLELVDAYSPEMNLALYESYWNSFLNTMRLFTDAEKFMQRHSNLKFAVVTDLTAHIQLRKLIQLKLSSKFDFIVTSEETGFDKPNGLNFLKALHKLKVQPENSIMVGDSFEKDAIGAADLEIQSYWLNRTNKTMPFSHPMVAEVTSFDEIELK